MNRETYDKRVQEELANIRAEYEEGVALDFATALLLCRKDDKGKVYTEDKPLHQYVAMPELDDQGSRVYLKEVAWKQDAFFVLVKLEAWFVQIPDDAPAELVAKIEVAQANHALDQLEPPLRREVVRVYAEAEDFVIQSFQAEIHRGSATVPVEQSKLTCSGRPSRATGTVPILDPWEEAKIKLPRPNFKRYLPEMRDGKRTLVLPGISIQ